MKRLFTSLVVLAALFVGTTAWAQTLRVAGVSVNLNATTTQTITGSNIQGSVTYSPSSRTLYLNGATIRGSISGEDLGTSSSTRYYIHLTGTNNLITSDRGIRFDDSYVVLYGAAGAQLVIDSNASSSGFSCISTEGGHFEVWGIRLSMIGASKGFYGNPGSASLGFVNSIVSIDCDAGAVYGYKYVTYDDCNFTDEGVRFQSGTGYVDGSGNRVTTFHVWPLLVVGSEPVRTAGDSKTGSTYSWKWTKSTKTLEITGNISTGAYTAISNYGIDGLTIKSDGNYTVSSSNIGIAFRKNTKLAGSGTLTVTSSTGNGIVARADMNVCMEGLFVQGKLHGFTDLHGGHKLTLEKYDNNSDYRFAGTSNACLYVSNLEMKYMDIYSNETWWNPKDGYAYYRDGIYRSSSTSSPNACVCFKSKSEISYLGLSVCGQPVRQNCSRIVSPYLTSGSIVYDASSKTLTVTDATLINPEEWGNVIDNTGIDGLTIELSGDNVFTSYSAPICAKSSFSITGFGSLVATGTHESGLQLYGNYMTCTIDGPDIEFIGYSYGMEGGVTNTLEVVYPWTRVTFDLAEERGGDGIPIYALGNLVLDSELGILEPSGGRFDTSKNCIVTPDGDYYYGKAVIGRIVLSIGEIPLSLANYADILGDGQFSYDPSTKTLTVTNATLTAKKCITNNYIDGLTIKLVGDNVLNSYSDEGYVIGSSESFTITGDGTLTGISKGEASGLCLSRPIICTIDGPQVEFHCNEGWCLLDWMGDAMLNVKGSTTRVTLSPNEDEGMEAINNLGRLTLDLGSGIKILEPEGAWFSSLLKNITTDGSNPYVGTIVIGSNLDIAATPADPEITNYDFTGAWPLLKFYIPTEDVNGNALQTSKLFYTVWEETGGEEIPFVVRASEYRDVTEDMVEIPYDYYDNFDIYFGGSTFYINPTDEPAYCSKFGVQSIYYSGGERRTSNIVWIDNPDYDPTGIESLSEGRDAADDAIYNLSGQRLSKVQKGINVVRGKKVLVK